MDAKLRDRAIARLHARLDPKPGPLTMVWVDDWRDCRTCGQPTQGRTMRGAAVHPGCDAAIETLTDEAYVNVLIRLAVALSATVRALPPAPAHRPLPPIPLRHGPCSWCRTPTPGIGILADAYYHCSAHLWPPYRWPERRPA